MSLKKISVPLELIQCDFCGTVHVSEEEAVKHGCTAAGDPQPAYKVGDKVLTHFDIAAGIECIGHTQTVEVGVVTEVRKPSSNLWVRNWSFGGLVLQQMTRSYGRPGPRPFAEMRSIQLEVPNTPHAWAYLVVPEKHQHPLGELRGGLYSEPQLRPVM